jgi:diaminopimelate epimerase
MSSGIPFRKMSGLGNEILVLDLRGGAQPDLSPSHVRAIAQRPRSQFDQMMVLGAARSAGTQAYVRIFNADGSEAEACGNGMRCIAWLEAERTGRSSLEFETKAGRLQVEVASRDRISVDMGAPKFGWRDIPLAQAFADTRAIALQVGPIDQPILHSPSVANVGNPHAVFWVDDVAAYDLGRLGPMLEHHSLFPERANISLARVTAASAITLRTWERGTGLTRACGSAACAAAVCAARKGLTGRDVVVSLPGGAIDIHWGSDDRIRMTGAIEFGYDGVLDAFETA